MPQDATLDREQTRNIDDIERAAFLVLGGPCSSLRTSGGSLATLGIEQYLRGTTCSRRWTVTPTNPATWASVCWPSRRTWGPSCWSWVATGAVACASLCLAA
jgi:hypothetical protein